MMRKSCSVGIAALAFLSAGAYGDTLPMDPGLWETTTTTTNSFVGTQTRTSQDCLTEGQFDPRSMMEEAGGCEVTDSDLNGDTLSFTMMCSMEGGQATMVGVYTSKGSTGSGTMDMNMSFSGQTMTSKTTFKGKRIGDC